MDLVLHKIRLAVLWLFWSSAAGAMLFLMLLETGVIDQIRGGEVEGMTIGPELLLFLAVMCLIPLVMAFLSVTLKNKANRFANIVMGTVILVMDLIDLGGSLAAPSAHMILLVSSKIVVSLLIIWYAYKWPKN